MRKNIKRLLPPVFAVFTATLAWSAPHKAAALEQEIHLKGTSNTRDIGGYLTEDLRMVRSGQIIRSENLSRLTEDDFQILEAMGVKTVIDLRSDLEHKQAPTEWEGDNPPLFHHFAVGDANDPWFRSQSRLMKKGRFTEAQSSDHMVNGYRHIASEATESYRSLMEVVMDESNWPLVIHCTAGKDRTGIAVALIYEALGVDRDTIMQEYLLTNEIGNSEAKARVMSKQSARMTRNRRGASPEAWLPIVGVQSQMLEAWYASIEEQHGSIDEFLLELGVDPEERNQLIESLTIEPESVAMEP